MTEPQKKQELIAAETPEIQSLNFEGLDVTELEKRLELASFNMQDSDPPTCGTLICALYYPTAE